jgi:hypothetical protein
MAMADLGLIQQRKEQPGTKNNRAYMEPRFDPQ